MVKELIKKDVILLDAHLSKVQKLLLLLMMIVFPVIAFTESEMSASAAVMPILATIIIMMPSEIEKKSKFPRYLLSATVTVKDLAAANFIFYFAVITITSLFAAVITAAAMLIHGNTPTIGEFEPLFWIAGFLFTFNAIYIPVSLKFGDNTAVIAAAVFFVSLVVFALIYALFGDIELAEQIFDAIQKSTNRSYYALAFDAFSVIAMLIGYFAGSRIKYLY
ncbi:MAG: ABC-2 transporter permease [Oscillospiraceae bacterium]|nr:ABC-2 transporter permease [Oscillospiraceae bacterium]